MKKFNEILNEKTNHYAANQIIQNKIWDLIEENLVAKMDGEISDKLSIIGKEKLVEELTKIVENIMLKGEISILESVKKDPTMINEFIEKLLDTKKFKKVKDDIKEDYKKIAETIKSLKDRHPLAGDPKKISLTTKDKDNFEKQKTTIENMIDNFQKKWEKESGRWESARCATIWNDVGNRVKELISALKDANYSDKLKNK